MFLLLPKERSWLLIWRVKQWRFRNQPGPVRDLLDQAIHPRPPVLGSGDVQVSVGGENVLAIPAMACEGFLGFLDILAIVQGLRALIKPGKA